MNYYFYSNGDSQRNGGMYLDDITRQIATSRIKMKGMEYAFSLVDISTEIKGPLYTMVRNKKLKNVPSPMEMTLDLSYDIPDVPPNPYSTFVNTIDMETPSGAYNGYPLVLQMIACNKFIESQSLENVDSRIYINKIRLSNKKHKLQITEKNLDKDIKDLFDRFGICTNMSDIMNSSFNCVWVSANSTWGMGRIPECFDEEELLSAIHMGWSKVLICFPEMESGYLISTISLLFFNRIREFSVKLIYTPAKEKNSTVDYLSSLDEEYESEYFASDVNNILKMCIFIPQIIKMEKSLYDMDVTIQLNVKQGDANISLTISKKETKNKTDLCLFHILERMIGLSINNFQRSSSFTYDYEQGNEKYTESIRRKDTD
jgi:hypothetical protein